MNLKLLANKVFSRTEHGTPVKQTVYSDEKKVFHSESEMKHQMEAEKPAPQPFYDDARELDSDKGDDVNFCFEPDPSDPAIPRVLVAAWWLEEHLTQPRRIGEVMAEWIGGTQQLQWNGSLRWGGGRDGTDGHWMMDLCEARWHLEIEAFVGDDGLMWWTSPKQTSLELMWTHRDVLFAQQERMKAARAA